MVRGGHIAVVASLGFAIPVIGPIFWAAAIIMSIVALVQRIQGYSPERCNGDGIYYVPEHAPERLPARAPKQIV